MTRGRHLAAAALALAVLAMAPAKACDRACLASIMDRWLNALPKHSAAGLPLAPGIRFTEQSAVIPVGDGLFISATQAPTAFKIVAADPVSGQVGALVMMKQWDKPALVAVRLKVMDGKIAEAQHIVATSFFPGGEANLVAPRAAFLSDVPPAERTPRAQMLAAADAYYQALEQDDGNLAPFADDCARRENGGQTVLNKRPMPPPPGVPPKTGAAMAKLGMMTCRAQINARLFQYITMIRPRMLVVIDEQKGLVMGFPRFVHRGDVRTMKIVGVKGVDRIPMQFGPIDLQAAEIFKIRSGKIHEVEANGFTDAYLTPTGWEDRYPETYRYAVTHPRTHPYQAGTHIP